MKKVITYGTYDLLHYGHIRLLERAKALGDYLIVAVTADDYDKSRGKINVKQSLIERVEAVRKTGIADEIIVEEYEGQKIDDIKKYDIDIFTVGSDWKGIFDYLSEYCEVVYLDRTEGISSSELRKTERLINLGIVGDSSFLNRIEKESKFVNGIVLSGICTNKREKMSNSIMKLPLITDDYQTLLDNSDAVYIHSLPEEHYTQIKQALQRGKHVLCESPIAMSLVEWEELQQIAKDNNCILMDALRTAYSTAFCRLLLLAKVGKIGKVLSVDATCTSLRKVDNNQLSKSWNSITAWGPTALLPIFQLLSTNYKAKQIVSNFIDDAQTFDLFTKISFVYPDSVASLKVGIGVKSEGELIISGTKGYIYVPAPWWKTDYFEIRYEDPSENKRYFYQLDGEGIRLELATFAKSIASGKNLSSIDQEVSKAICEIVEDFKNREDMVII